MKPSFARPEKKETDVGRNVKTVTPGLPFLRTANRIPVTGQAVRIKKVKTKYEITSNPLFVTTFGRIP